MYSSNYLRIYLWQGAAFILRFVSMFIVMPYLTKSAAAYGIYAVCVSVTVFLSYADMGFLKACQKYAAECYARGERIEEMRYIGFGTFVLLFFTLLASAVFFYLAQNPGALITGLDTAEKNATASSLLLILSAFAPVTVLQRMMSMVFDIRLETYLYQRISVCASLVTIVSVFYFFGEGQYRIVPYFLFSQVVNLAFVIYCLWNAKKHYEYDMKQLFRYISPNGEVYNKVKALAYSGLYVMVIWVLFYELDQVVVAKLLGIDKVAVYAIAFTFATLFRSIFGIVFSPFTVRANHFCGNADNEGLREYSLKLVVLTAPLVVLPITGFVLVAEPFVLSWVGDEFRASVRLAQLLSLVYLFCFNSYTASMVLLAKERIRDIYLVSTIQPVVFWVGILGTYSFLGLTSFAVFKLVATVLTEIYYLQVLCRYLSVSPRSMLQRTLYPLILPLSFLAAFLAVVQQYLPHEKSKTSVILVIAVTGAGVIIALCLQCITSREFRDAGKQAWSTTADGFRANGLRKKITAALGL